MFSEGASKSLSTPLGDVVVGDRKSSRTSDHQRRAGKKCVDRQSCSLRSYSSQMWPAREWCARSCDAKRNLKRIIYPRVTRFRRYFFRRTWPRNDPFIGIFIGTARVPPRPPHPIPCPAVIAVYKLFRFRFRHRPDDNWFVRVRTRIDETSAQPYSQRRCARLG
jgi:hypothetical protein